MWFTPWLPWSAFLGLLSISPSHNLQDPAAVHLGYKTLTPEMGLRVAYLRGFVGAEIEGTFGITRTLDPDEMWGSTASGKAHVLLTLPEATHGLRPFVVAGGGVMGAFTSVMGNDLDPSVHAGIGTWWQVSEQWRLRGDVRGSWTQKVGAPQGELTVHPTFTLGLEYAGPKAVAPVVVPIPVPVPVPVPEPVPEPTPEPAPEPLPEPLPEPVPEPLPEPAPEPAPEPTPEVVPEPPQEPKVGLAQHAEIQLIRIKGTGRNRKEARALVAKVVEQLIKQGVEASRIDIDPEVSFGRPKVTMTVIKVSVETP